MFIRKAAIVDPPPVDFSEIGIARAAGISNDFSLSNWLA